MEEEAVFEYPDADTLIYAGSIVAGIIYGVYRRQKPGIVFLYAIGFGILGVTGKSLVNQLTRL